MSDLDAFWRSRAALRLVGLLNGWVLFRIRLKEKARFNLRGFLRARAIELCFLNSNSVTLNRKRMLFFMHNGSKRSQQFQSTNAKYRAYRSPASL